MIFVMMNFCWHVRITWNRLSPVGSRARNRAQKKVLWKWGLFKNIHTVEILEKLGNFEILEIHFLEVLEILEILDIS